MTLSRLLLSSLYIAFFFINKIHNHGKDIGKFIKDLVAFIKNWNLEMF